MAQLMPLPLTVSCFSKIQIGLTNLIQARPGSPGQRAVKRVCAVGGGPWKGVCAAAMRPLPEYFGHLFCVSRDTVVFCAAQGGQTALAIAERLGYISVIDILRSVTNHELALASAPAVATGDKYSVQLPETMHDSSLSDSDDDGTTSSITPTLAVTVRTSQLIGSESVPIQLAQCWFPGLAISSAKILIYF